MGTKKRILSVLVVVAMLVSTVVTAVFADSNFTVTASSVTAEAGDTVNVTISLANNPGVIALRLAIGYDSDVLTLTNISDGGLLGSESHTSYISDGVSHYDLSANPYKLYWINGEATTNYTSNGTAATLTFSVANDAALGEYPITVSVLDSQATNGTSGQTEVACAAVNGKVTVQHVHSYGAWTSVDANNHKRVCACGAEEVEAHTWDSGVVTTPATHTSTGVKTYTCTVCGATKTETIAKLEGHTYGEWTSVDANNHHRVCECGAEEVGVHTWDSGVVTTPATHTSTGVKTYTCTVCGATKTETIAKLEGHTYGEWTSVDANNHHRVCECGAEEVGAHTWDSGVVTTEPTATTDGVKTYTCTVCGATKTEVIPKTGPAQVLGDVNGDGSVDIRDAILLFNYSMSPEDYTIGYVGSVDFNKDGSVDIRDAILLFNYSMSPEDYSIE